MTLSVWKPGSVTNDCGTLEIVQPAVLGREVILKFTPTDQTRSSDGIWYHAYYSISKYSIIDTETTQHVTQKNGSIFSLTIKQSNDNDEGYYTISTKYENGAWICSSGRVELKLQGNSLHSV